MVYGVKPGSPAHLAPSSVHQTGALPCTGTPRAPPPGPARPKGRAHDRTDTTRRLATLGVIAAAAIGLVAVARLTAQGAATPTNVGLYGSTDPTYDGVFRQSLAILGLHAAGKTPDPTAITWLLDQQCADGGFSSYNPAPAKGCPKYDPSAYTGGVDTNATSLALQALLATGHSKEAAKAAKVLRGRSGQGRRLAVHRRRRQLRPQLHRARDVRARRRRRRRRS